MKQGIDLIMEGEGSGFDEQLRHEGDKKGKADEPVLQFLIVRVGSEKFGIDIHSVREVIEYDRTFAVPRSPDYIRGVTNLRGEVISVIDLGILFYGSAETITVDSAIVFVEISYNDTRQLIGVCIDEVLIVAGISFKEIGSVSETGAGIPYEYISNVAKLGDEHIIILNMANVLNLQDLSDFAP